MAAIDGTALRGVRKKFTRRGPWVLDGIDLTVAPGSATVIVGGNGSGKTTLLRIAAGLTVPTSGQVGIAPTVGYVPERLAARSRFTGREYVTQMGRIRGLDDATIEVRSRELFDRLDVQPGPDVPYDALSKGNRQKLALIQAFLAPVAVLILDEPFTGLDAAAHRCLGELVNGTLSAESAVLVSTHRTDSGLAGDHVVTLNDGRLGPAPTTALEQPTWSAVERTVVLTAGPNARPPAEIVRLPGILWSTSEPAAQMLSLIVEDPRCDEVLSTAIALGWSVVSVGTPGGHEGLT